ncbi:THAP domain-containing protein 5-like [Coccinella septempunctata]|uniref:THAP domain-containing protein 5-like n=1 Tax=Coccinella septempunctata TaxID=41139 RepID=UPI001D07A660|nr:THAP domain-containing protein 5-like [Coccinella septempunctata]
MPGCAVINCKNSAKKGFLMKHFPKDPSRRKQWIINMKRDNWNPTKYSCLCEVHFAPEAWEKTRVDGKRVLKVSAVPTIFAPKERKPISPKKSELISKEEPNANNAYSSKHSGLIEKIKAETTKLFEHLTNKCDESVLFHVLGTIKNLNNLLEVSYKNDHERQDLSALQSKKPDDKRITEQRVIFSSKRRHTMRKKLISRPSQKNTSIIKSNPIKLGCILENINNDHNYFRKKV